MRKPVSADIARPLGATRRVPRTRAEAAVELVRLEFDAARLNRELDQLEKRAKRAGVDLERTQQRAGKMLERLRSDDGTL
ncbi:MAG: hypothetical protein AAF646_03255 [Pseudomonadota bacterium]